MILTVLKLSVPAMSTVGCGVGVDEKGVKYWFMGDHRPMRYLVEKLKLQDQFGGDDPIQVEVENWQILGVLNGAGE